MSEQIRVILFKDGNIWLAQALEHDICVQAENLEDLYGRFQVAVALEAGGRDNLDHIQPAPKHFFNLWEKRSGSYKPVGANDSNFEMALAA